ncbi:MAG TPA: hypothetical protein VK620_30280, partial [Bradyrhizobium sp.]|nr:hypothetical protein [Bradyrhizobium sp.]
MTLCVNQSLAKTAAGVNYPSARLPRLIQIVAPFSSRLSRDSIPHENNFLHPQLKASGNDRRCYRPPWSSGTNTAR